MEAFDQKTMFSLLSGITFGIGLGWLMSLRFPSRKLDHDDDDESELNLEDDEEWTSDEEEEEVKGGNYKMVLVVRTDLKMGKGKSAAQCCHATLGCYKQAKKNSRAALKAWEGCGQPKVVVKCSSEDELMALYQNARASGLTCSLVRDAGRTQISPGSKTVLGVGPALEEQVDLITGHLKLQ